MDIFLPTWDYVADKKSLALAIVYFIDIHKDRKRDGRIEMLKQ